MSNQRYVSDTLKKKKKTVRKIKAYLFLLACALAVTGVVFLLRLSAIQITEVTIEGNGFVSTQEIQDKTDRILGSSYLFVIPKSNVFLFSRGELASRIKENPAVIDVRIDKDLFHTLNISITEQEKEAIYCTSFDRSECYYINGDGYLYSRTPADLQLDQEIVVYLEGEQKKLRDTVLDTELYSNVMGFVKSSARYGLITANVYVRSNGVIEFNTQPGARLLVSRFDDFASGFSNLIALFDQNVIAKEQLAIIDYIDLRFGNKVFYKNRTP